MNNEDVYCVEDYYFDESGRNLNLVLFNTSAFYREVANNVRRGNRFDDFLRQPIHHRIGGDYDNAILSVDVQNLFESVVVDADTANKWLSSKRPVQYVTRRRVERGNLNARNSENENQRLIINRSIEDSRFYRRFLNRPPRSETQREALSGRSLKYAAIVNVGCGNCCFIFDENNVLAIDCSNRDKAGGHFQANVGAAIRWIQTIQRGRDFHIDCFLLTHPHYDHYSAVRDFIRSEFIDSNTLCFINLRYGCSVGAYTQMLAALRSAGVRCIDNPVAGKVVGPLRVLHPVDSPARCKKLNNASVLSAVSTERGDFIFPGDIENSIGDEGWNIVRSPVMDDVRHSAYYLLSHHGSHNGFGTSLRDPIYSFCSTHPREYSGVPDPATLAMFQNLRRTDALNSASKTCRFIEVDLAAGTATYKWNS